MSETPKVVKTTKQPTTTTPGKPPKYKAPAKKPTAQKPATAKKTPGPDLERAKRDPAYLAQLLRDPGNRSKLPDSLLPPDLLAKRKNNQFLGSLGDLATPLSGSSLVNVAQILADRGYNQTLSDIGAATKAAQDAAKLRGDRAAGYDKTLQDILASSIAGQATANTNAIGTLKGIGDTAAKVIEQAHADHAADLVQSAADQDPRFAAIARAGGDAAARDAAARNAAGNAAAQTNAQANGDAMAAILRAAQAGSAQNAAATQGDIQAALGQTLGELARKRADASDQRQTDFIKTLLDLRGTEADRALAAATAVGKSVAEQQQVNQYGYTNAQWAAMTPAQRTAAVAKFKADTTVRDGGRVNSYGYTEDEWRAMSTAERQKIINDAKAKKGKKGKSQWVSPEGQARVKDSIDGVIAQIKDLQSKGKSEAEIRKLLLNGRPASTVDYKGQKVKVPAIPKVKSKDYLNVAMDVVYRKFISAPNVRALHNRRIKVKALGYPLVPPTPAQQIGTGVANVGATVGNLLGG